MKELPKVEVEYLYSIAYCSVKCPFCGHEQVVNFDPDSPYSDDEHNCDKCGKKFEMYLEEE